MFNKKESRLRRSRQTRAKIKELNALRLCVHRTNQHIYAQIISADTAGHVVVASASSQETLLRSEITNGGNIAAASKIGRLIAERAKEKGVDKVAFDRSGFRYHGRVKALAEAAREAGLNF